MRACFVGQREYFEQCSLLTPAGGVEPFFVDHRGGSDPAPVRVALESVRPDVVLVFRPETLPAGFLREAVVLDHPLGLCDIVECAGCAAIHRAVE